MISENSCSSSRINWQNWHKTLKLAKTATFPPRASSYFSASMLSSWLSFFFGLSEVLAQVNEINQKRPYIGLISRNFLVFDVAEVPYDPMEDEDQSLTTSKTKVIVKLKKKACVCLRESQMNDYNNFVWNLKHFRTNDEKKKKKEGTCLKSKIKLSQCI